MKSKVFQSFVKGLKRSATEGASGLKISGTPGRAAYTAGTEIGRQAGGLVVAGGLAGGTALAAKGAVKLLSKMRKPPSLSLGQKVIRSIVDNKSPLITGGLIGGAILGTHKLEKRAAKSPNMRDIKKVLTAGVDEIKRREISGKSIGQKALGFLKEYRQPLLTGGVGGSAAMLPYWLSKGKKKQPQYVLFQMAQPKANQTKS